VFLDGRELPDMPRAHVARQVAYVPQEAKLEFEFSVREIVLMGRLRTPWTIRTRNR